eukprot:m.354460 g.354460  ORF g.354460 m.354460 type:complete len:459 (-) comp17030_c0_seq1:1401-2777(-)
MEPPPQRCKRERDEVAIAGSACASATLTPVACVGRQNIQGSLPPTPSPPSHTASPSTSTGSTMSPRSQAVQEWQREWFEVVDFSTMTDPQRNVYIANFHEVTSYADLHLVFSRAGLIKQLQLLEKPPNRYAFVKYYTKLEAQRAVRMLNRKMVHGKRLSVRLAAPRGEHVLQPCMLLAPQCCALARHLLGFNAVNVSVKFVSRALLSTARKHLMARTPPYSADLLLALLGETVTESSTTVTNDAPATATAPTTATPVAAKQTAVHSTGNPASPSQSAAGVPEGKEGEVDRETAVLMCGLCFVVELQIQGLPKPITGGVIVAEVLRVASLLAPPRTITDAASNVYRVAYNLALRQAFTQLRLVYVGTHDLWLPARVANPFSTQTYCAFPEFTETALLEYQQSTCKSVFHTTIDPFVEVTDDEEDGEDGEGGEGEGNAAAVDEGGEGNHVHQRVEQAVQA